MNLDSGGPPPPSQQMNVEDRNKKKIVHMYQDNDYGPYQVYIQANEELEKNIGNFNHLSIAREIFELNLQDIKKIEKKGKNRLSVEFNNFKAANKFLEHKTVLDKGYNMFIPSHLVSCRGIVKYVDKNFTIEELYKFTKILNQKVIDIKRLNRRTTNDKGETIYVPTGTVLYTFSGRVVPRSIDICFLTMPVLAYKLPVVQCYNCLRYGHISKQCKGKKSVIFAQKCMKGNVNK